MALERGAPQESIICIKKDDPPSASILVFATPRTFLSHTNDQMDK